jgi:hypothetical protein
LTVNSNSTGSLSSQSVTYGASFLTSNGGWTSNFSGTLIFTEWTVPHGPSYTLTVATASGQFDPRIVSWSVWRTKNNGTGSLYELFRMPIGITSYIDNQLDSLFAADIAYVFTPLIQPTFNSTCFGAPLTGTILLSNLSSSNNATNQLQVSVGGVASADVNNSTAYKAFYNETGWNSGTSDTASHWVQFQFTSPHLISLTQMGSPGANPTLNNFVVQGSNNGSTFTNLSIPSTIGPATEILTPITSSISYTYVRFQFNAATPGSVTLGSGLIFGA